VTSVCLRYLRRGACLLCDLLRSPRCALYANLSGWSGARSRGRPNSSAGSMDAIEASGVSSQCAARMRCMEVQFYVTVRNRTDVDWRSLLEGSLHRAQRPPPLSGFTATRQFEVSIPPPSRCVATCPKCSNRIGQLHEPRSCELMRSSARRAASSGPSTAPGFNLSFPRATGI